MEPGVRTLLLGFGLAFCVVLAALTIRVAIDTGLDILTLTSLAVVAMLALGLAGAIRNPPDG